MLGMKLSFISAKNTNKNRTDKTRLLQVTFLQVFWFFLIDNRFNVNHMTFAEGEDLYN